LKLHSTSLEGVWVVEPDVFADPRGFFMETYRESRYQQAGIPDRFVQDNLSRSERGVLRGLHFQNPNAQAKLVSVLEGEVFDVAVDIRRGSPSFSRWFGVKLSAENKLQLYVPAGFAHGFCVISETALFSYKCSADYDPASERCIRWDDPRIGIAWPLEEEPKLSGKDAAAAGLDAFPEEWLPEL